MKLSQLLRDVPVKALYADPDMQIDALEYDSRRVGSGIAFAAVQRASADGTDYIDAAVKNGASLVIAGRKVEGVPCVVVENPNRALAAMSANLHGRPADSLQMIGVTGTKGKTTTSHLIREILEKGAGVRVGLIGTLGCMVGNSLLEDAHNTTPETPELHAMLRRMLDAGCTHVVMEVSSHALALDRVYGISFRVGIFNNITQDHLDFHKTMEAYLEAKTRLFSMCETGVVNIDDPHADYILQHASCRLFTVSAKDDGADLAAKNIRFKEEHGVEFEALVEGGIRRVSLPIPGIFSVYNALSAIGSALALGIDLDAAIDALRNVPGVRGRMEVVPTDGAYRVIIDYAHTPDSIEKAVAAAHDFTPGRVISVFGCGGNRDRTKRPLMAAAAAGKSGLVVITTDNPRSEEPAAIIRDILPGIEGSTTPFEVVENRREAIGFALRAAKPGDTVLIMGKGHETYQEIHGVREHFDDREEVLRYLQSGK